jgi:hypothetical protein
MGNVAGTGEDSGNNPPQTSHARTARTLARTVRGYMRTVRCYTRTIRRGSSDSMPNVVVRAHVWVIIKNGPDCCWSGRSALTGGRSGHVQIG